MRFLPHRLPRHPATLGSDEPTTHRRASDRATTARFSRQLQALRALHERPSVRSPARDRE